MKRDRLKRTGLIWLLGFLLGLFATEARAQESATRRTIALSDPSLPAVVKATVLQGSILVESYDGQDVVIEVRPAGGASPKRGRSGERPEDAENRAALPGGLKVTEADNIVAIRLEPHLGPADLRLTVPRATNLKLRNVGNGEIRVTKVQGQFELESLNGSIVLTDVSGAAVAHTVNGRLKADFTRVAPEQAMSFATVNGEIDLTFPAELKAKVKLASVTGKVACDFAVKPDQATPKRQWPGLRGMAVSGLINGGGGADLRVATVNGSIRINKR
ncbi:MAG: DUF4097 family beta strand repeat protein [Verrucomicrobia bacterium]|nr:DUF4097 family beta strand repeat protein [Verrucomicrobiota bacterium]